MDRRWNEGAGKQECPEKTRWQAASFNTIPTCEDLGANPPGIEPGSPWWEASALATAPPLPHLRSHILGDTLVVMADIIGDAVKTDPALIAASIWYWVETQTYLDCRDMSLAGAQRQLCVYSSSHDETIISAGRSPRSNRTFSTGVCTLLFSLRPAPTRIIERAVQVASNAHDGLRLAVLGSNLTSSAIFGSTQRCWEAVDSGLSNVPEGASVTKSWYEMVKSIEPTMYLARLGRKSIKAQRDNIRLSLGDVAHEAAPGVLTPHDGNTPAELQQPATQEEDVPLPPSARSSLSTYISPIPDTSTPLRSLRDAGPARCTGTAGSHQVSSSDYPEST
ncbi:hypothetical protein PR048_004717 [Dryococelus australis]|uniref:Uncharacterized protein n=1 Tax=Dryococelus australis TaxID=614101 RepID=A0ABQ9I658_9NEOP|nr:hypothetical protein PR048_004717 [Dryococelus australis]